MVVNELQNLLAECEELLFQAKIVTVLGNVIHAVLGGRNKALIYEILVKDFADAAVHYVDEVNIKHSDDIALFPR